MEKKGHFCKITEQTDRQMIPTFDARASVIFAYVVVPGGESWNY